MDEPLTVLCIAQGTNKPIYDIPLDIAVVRVFDTDDSGTATVGFQAYREDVEDALTIYAKRHAISDPGLSIYKIKAANNVRTGKIIYGDVALIEYP